jgi:hypothetical protein
MQLRGIRQNARVIARRAKLDAALLPSVLQRLINPHHDVVAFNAQTVVDCLTIQLVAKKGKEDKVPTIISGALREKRRLVIFGIPVTIPSRLTAIYGEALLRLAGVSKNDRQWVTRTRIEPHEANPLDADKSSANSKKPLSLYITFKVGTPEAVQERVRNQIEGVLTLYFKGKTVGKPYIKTDSCCRQACRGCSAQVS